jgi:hypothetical protein
VFALLLEAGDVTLKRLELAVEVFLLLRSLELAVEVVLLWRHASPSLGPHGAAPDRNH